MRILWAIALVFAAIVMTIVIGFAVAFWPEPSTFSVEKWPRTTYEKRSKMAEDFLANYYREGMSVEEVKALLGSPDFMPDHEHKYLSYLVGDMVIDDVVLFIPIMEDGTTGKAHISVHGS